MSPPHYPVLALELSSQMLLALMVGHIYKEEINLWFSGDNGIPKDCDYGVCVPPLLDCDPLGSRREQ